MPQLGEVPSWVVFVFQPMATTNGSRPFMQIAAFGNLGSFRPYAAKCTNVRIRPSRDGAVTLVSPLSNSTKLNSIEQKARYRARKAPTFNRSFYWRHVALAAVCFTGLTNLFRPWHCRGQGFDPPRLHQFSENKAQLLSTGYMVLGYLWAIVSPVY